MPQATSARCARPPIPRVVFTGYVFGEGYRELLSNAYCFVETSEVGGTHPALLEAMAAGAAVVVNDTPENLETIGDAGQSYDGGIGAPSLRAALERLLKDPALVAALGRRALERVRAPLLLGSASRTPTSGSSASCGRRPMTLGKRRAEWVLRLLAADVVVLLVAFLVAYRLRAALDGPIGRVAAPLGHYLWLLGLIVPMWVGLLAASGAYGIGWTTRSRFWLVLRVSVVGLLALTAGLFLVKAEEVNRSVLAPVRPA